MSLGLKAIEAGYRVLFTTAAHLSATLSKAHAEGRLDDKLKVFTTPRLLLIDERTGIEIPIRPCVIMRMLYRT